jgi:hypothetical protein
VLPISKVDSFVQQHFAFSDIYGYIQSLHLKSLDWCDAVEKGTRVWNELQSALERDPMDKPTAIMFGSSDPWRVANFNPVPMVEDLTDVFKYLNLPWSPGDFYTRIAVHNHEDDVKTWYKNSYNVKDGIIIAEWNKRPQRETAHWSQVTFELWSELARLADVRASNLKWIVRHNVENHDTVRIILNAYLNFGTRSASNIQSWTLRNNRNVFYALLGTVNGKGIAHMLKDYTKAFGRTTIQEIFTAQTIDPNNGRGIYHMVFRVGPASETIDPIWTDVHSKRPNFSCASNSSSSRATGETARENRFLHSNRFASLPLEKRADSLPTPINFSCPYYVIQPETWQKVVVRCPESVPLAA